MLGDQSGYRAIVMRLPALFALAALVGLSACDSAKVSELTGAKPAPTQIAAACPPATTVAPVCPPAQPAMAPEAGKPAQPAAVAPAAVARIQPIARTHAPAQRRRLKVAHHPVAPRPHPAPPVRRFAYAGGYTGETSRGEAHLERHGRRHHPQAYARPDEAYAYRYERHEDGYARDGDREERREAWHAPYVDEGRDDGAYRYEHHESSMERGGSSYEHRESGYSSDNSAAGGYADDCNCRPQAAGRDRQGFLTWPGKR
jgi:hypothetical protein